MTGRNSQSTKTLDKGFKGIQFEWLKIYLNQLISADE